MALEAIVNGTPLKHGILWQAANAVASDNLDNMTAKARAEFEKKQKHNAKMVRGRFYLRDKDEVYNEMAYTLGSGKPIVQYRFIDGYTYEIPQGLFDKVNNEGYTMKRGQMMNRDGSIAPHDSKYILREFIPVAA